MTLALLLTAATGAWAEETPLVTIYASSDFTSGSKTFDNKVKATFSNEVSFIANNGWCAVTAGNKTLTVEPVDGVTITRVKYYTTLGPAEDIKAPFEASMSQTYVYVSSSSQQRFHVSVNGSRIGAEDTHNYLQKIEVYGSAEPPIEVNPVAEPAANTKQWTFTQPGGDVVLTPLYAPTATWATMGTEPEAKTLLPAAAEGVIAGTDAPLIVDGVVAKAGETKKPQGTVMYAVTPTSGTDASELIPSDWKNTVPTAKTVADDGATVKVWYYIQGADTPDGVAATAENTFNDSEVSSLTVTVLSNKFDLTLKAANANTIDATQASKGTVKVKVGDADAEDKTKDIADGKLTGIKMGSEVKLNTKAGYKFRKVEVKKKAEGKPLANATTEDLGKVVGADGKIYATKADAEAVATGNAVAMICYVNEGHGLALALSDISSHYHSWDNSGSYNEGKTAAELCSAWNTSKAVTGATWKLASKSEMSLMINAAGNYAALRDGFSAVGGTNMIDEYYWLSDESSSDYAENINFSYGSWSQEFKNVSYKVRACLEW